MFLTAMTVQNVPRKQFIKCQSKRSSPILFVQETPQSIGIDQAENLRWFSFLSPPPTIPSLPQPSPQPKTNATRLAAIAEYFAKSLGKQISASLICNNLLERIHQRRDFAPFREFFVKSGYFCFIGILILMPRSVWFNINSMCQVYRQYYTVCTSKE